MDKLIFLPIFLPIIIAVFIYLFNQTRLINIIYIMEIGLLALSIRLLFYVNKGQGIYKIIGGWDQLIGIALKISKNEALLILLSSILFFIILIYTHKNEKYDSKFLFFFLMLQGSFNGFVMSDDLFNIFVMLELITIISTILIIYKKDAHSLKAGIYYLLFNSIGMIFFLMGLIIIYIKFGSLNLSYIKDISIASDYDAALRFAVILIISGFSVKSAVFPVYDWLPKAHSASLASISAILSGLLVKTGIIGLMKITTVFTLYNYSSIFLIFGIITGFLGVIFAFSQKDIKQILSFHTVSQIGLIMIGFSINIEVAMLYLINHSFIKTLLFLDSGIIINKYKERRINKINSVWINAPLLSITLIAGTLALSGIPFTSGFISKATLGASIKDIDKLTMLMIVNAFTFASMLKILSVLPGKNRFEFKIDRNKYISIISLVVIIIYTGLIMTDIVSINRLIWNYFNVKTLVKMIVELSVGYLIFWRFSKNELLIMKKIRHFSISFPDGVMLLTVFVFILIFTFR